MGNWQITQPQRLDLDEEINRIDVSLIRGRLNVVGTDGPPRVEVTRKGPAPLLVDLSDGHLSLRHEKPSPWRHFAGPFWWWVGARRYDADVSVAVPRQVFAQLNMIAGPVVASGIQGQLDLLCVSGRVTLLGCAGRINTRVTSGSIQALGCAGDIWLETVSGSITLADSSAEQVTAKTVSGSITADLDNPPHDNQISLDTVSGGIIIRVREDSDLTVNLSATSGQVTSEFPELTGRGGKRKSAYGMLGAGTGKLFANAISGSISLLRRPVADDFDEPEDD